MCVGCTWRSPLATLTRTMKNTISVDHQPARHLARRRVHVDEQRHEHDDRDRVQRDRERRDQLVEDAEAHQQRTPPATPSTMPDDQADQRVRARTRRRRPRSRPKLSTNADQIALGAGRKYGLMSNALTSNSHSGERTPTPKTHRRHDDVAAAPSASRTLASIARSSVLDPPSRRHGCGLDAAQRLADLGDLVEELGRPRGCRRCGRGRGRRRSTSVMRPGRGDITTTRSDRYTASGIEWVTNTTVVPVAAQMRSSSACMCSRVISSSAPNGSSISSSCGWAASARAIATRCCMPPDSCHGMCGRSPASLTSSSISCARSRALRLVPALQLERQLDVLLDGAPLEQPGLLERHAVVLVEPGLVRPTCR